MKILCISDQIDPLVYSSTIKDRFNDVDLILSAGDLPMDYLEFIVSSLNKPLLFVFGNHNLREFEYYQPRNPGYPTDLFQRDQLLTSGAIHLGNKLLREGPLLLAGLGGSIRYNKGKNQYSDFQMRMQMWALVPKLVLNRIFHGRYLDILLTHAPPAGIHDKDDPCHRGFKSFLWFMKKFRPRYLIHGHIHLYDLNDVRKTQYCDTTVINAYSHFLIDTGDN